MKLFIESGEKIEPIWYVNEDGDKVHCISEKIMMKLNQKTVEYLLDESITGKTITRIRYLIANLFNSNAYPNVNLFSLIRNSDEEHQELVLDIISILQNKYADSCFVMIDGLAPEIIDMFNIPKIEY